MSRNNFVIVVNDKRVTKTWFYVITDANAYNDLEL